jgi:hypothetical protein
MAEENEYATPKAFLDLYHSFTGNADPSYPAKSNIGSMLSGAVQRNEVGPLILATPTGLYVYAPRSRGELVEPTTGPAQNLGFSKRQQSLMSDQRLPISPNFTPRPISHGAQPWKSFSTTFARSENSMRTAKIIGWTE